MAVLTKDDRFMEVHSNRKAGAKNMCEFLDNAINTGIQQGQQSILISLIQKGLISVEQAAAEINITSSDFRKMIADKGIQF